MIAQRTFGSIATAAGIAAMSLVTFAGAALAEGHRHRHGGGREFGAHRPAPPLAYRHGHVREYGRHHGNHGAAVALGIGALFLGAVIAAESQRRHADRDED